MMLSLFSMCSVFGLSSDLYVFLNLIIFFAFVFSLVAVLHSLSICCVCVSWSMWVPPSRVHAKQSETHNVW